MEKRLLTILLALAPLLPAAGDIAPRPIQAKGLVSPGSIEIRLVRERIAVDLYKDSSVVECMFVLKNDGKSQILNIGFPEMYFYHSRPVPDKVPENFLVFENEKPVNSIEVYRPDKTGYFSISGDSAGIASTALISSTSDNPEKKPWLLWDSQFEENETKIITVRYSLPYGVSRNRCRYFNYLLSTGAGWKGNIESAEIIVNLKDLDYELVLQATPASYSRDQNQVKWIFTDLEPTTDHDIKIYYEPVKGDYERLVALYPDPAYYIDGEKVWDGGMFDDRSGNPFRQMKAEDILSVSIPKSSQKEIYGYENVVLVTTKNCAINKFVEQIVSRYPKLKFVKSLPHYEFIERYNLEIDGVHFENQKMLEKLSQTDITDTRKIRIDNKDDGRVSICIQTKKKRPK